MIKRYYVRTKFLQEGMIIDQAIIDKLGRTLIARGTKLNAYLIHSLESLGIPCVYVREGEEDEVLPEEPVISKKTEDTIQKYKVPDRSKVRLSESVKKRVSEGIQYLYSNPESENFTITSNSIANDLMKAITDNDAIAVDIGTLKVSDEYTFKHSVDVATMAMIVAKQYGLPDNEIYQIGISGLLHDVGKSKIPKEILNKPGKLTDEEFALMKQHPLFGYAILREKNDISTEIAMGVLQHHEKINGKGYPLGLKDDQISTYARILTVTDIYDALVTVRPYKKVFSQRDAVEMIMSMTQELDINVMRSFLKSVILYPVDATITLSNGEKARVVENNQENILRPKVVGLRTGRLYNLSEDVHCANLVIV